MVVGVGIDLVKIQKTARLVEKFGDRFLAKVFTEQEIAAGKVRALPTQEFSAWFAAKEAVQKALGAGGFGGIRFKEIEVVSVPGGKPGIKLSGKAEKRAEALGVGKIHLSLSHESDYAVAVALIERCAARSGRTTKES